MIWQEPYEIGGHTVRNRIVFPPLSGNWAEADGSVSDRILDFYRDIANGGAGFVVVSGTAVSPEGKGSDRTLCLYDRSHLPGIRELADIIGEQGALPAIQLMHVGGQGNPHWTEIGRAHV